MPRRRLATAMAIALAVGSLAFAGCSGDSASKDSTTTTKKTTSTTRSKSKRTTTSTTAKPKAADPEASATLRGYVDKLSTEAAHTDPIVVSGAPVVVAALERSKSDHVVSVLSLAGADVTSVAELSLPKPVRPFDRTTPIAIGDVTGDGEPDFLVTIDAGSTKPAVVVSNDGGSWRLVQKSDDTNDVYFGPAAAFDHGELVTVGKSWRYDEGTGQFAAA